MFSECIKHFLEKTREPNLNEVTEYNGLSHKV